MNHELPDTEFLAYWLDDMMDKKMHLMKIEEEDVTPQIKTLNKCIKILKQYQNILITENEDE